MRDEIAHRPEDGDLIPVFAGQNLQRLEGMRVAADDRADALVGKELPPFALLRVRRKLVFKAPVREDQNDIRDLLRPCNVGGAFFLVQEIDLPVVAGNAHVRAIGVVQDRNANALALHHAEDLRVRLAVVYADDRDLRILPPECHCVLNPAGELVIAVVRSLGNDIEARVRQRCSNVHRSAEDRIVRVFLRVVDEDRLLVDAGQIGRLDLVADIPVEIVEIIGSVAVLPGLQHGRVHQIVAQAHQIHGRVRHALVRGGLLKVEPVLRLEPAFCQRQRQQEALGQILRREGWELYGCAARLRRRVGGGRSSRGSRLRVLRLSWLRLLCFLRRSCGRGEGLYRGAGRMLHPGCHVRGSLYQLYDQEDQNRKQDQSAGCKPCLLLPPARALRRLLIRLFRFIHWGASILFLRRVPRRCVKRGKRARSVKAKARISRRLASTLRSAFRAGR